MEVVWNFCGSYVDLEEFFSLLKASEKAFLVILPSPRSFGPSKDSYFKRITFLGSLESSLR